MINTPFFYEPTVSAASSFLLSEETSKHCIQVLRMLKGAVIQLTDGKGNLFKASIQSVDKKQTTVAVKEHQFYPNNQRNIGIGISILKNSARFEWFLEKAAEVGVQEITPLICERTERLHFRYNRMQNILIAAMLQSQQTWLPTLKQPRECKEVIRFSNYSQKLIAHCEDSRKEYINLLPLNDKIEVLIGPEGDFTSSEIQLAAEHGYQSISLGNTRLRTETAGIVAVTLLRNANHR